MNEPTTALSKAIAQDAAEIRAIKNRNYQNPLAYVHIHSGCVARYLWARNLIHSVGGFRAWFLFFKARINMHRCEKMLRRAW